MNTMKRSRHAVAIGIGLAMTLAGCGSADNRGEGDLRGAPKTKVIEADNGSITVPEKPERIVSIGGTTGYLLEWGMQPVGVSDQNANFLRWQDDKALDMYESAEKVGKATELSYEKIANLKPDLIIMQVPQQFLGSSIDQAQLEEIAPTVILSVGVPEWKEGNADIADAVGATQNMEEDKQEYDDLVATLREKYGNQTSEMQFGAVNSWGLAGNDVFAREYENSTCTIYATDVGFDFPGKASTGAPFEDVSMERLGDLSDLDAVMYPLNRDGTPKEEMQPILDSDVWTNAGFVREKRTLPVQCPFGTFTYKGGVTNLTSLGQALDKYFADNPR